jgi:hypothetical protein
MDVQRHQGFHMIDSENYIIIGDRVIAIPKTTCADPFHGRVIQVVGTDVGRREFIIELEGTNVVAHGAIGVPEAAFFFEVERGDAWVNVPPFLLAEEAEAKAARSLLNTAKRIQKKVPLFADQISVEKSDVRKMIARIAQGRREHLQREHELARRSTDSRDQVASMVAQDQFLVLQGARSRFPRSAAYGTYFWEKQLRHLKETGKPDIYDPPPAINRRLEFDWLKPDLDVKWLSPDGPRPARVLFVGNSVVLLKLPGEPFRDFDPKQFPYGNCWVEPQSLQSLDR